MAKHLQKGVELPFYCASCSRLHTPHKASLLAQLKCSVPDKVAQASIKHTYIAAHHTEAASHPECTQERARTQEELAAARVAVADLQEQLDAAQREMGAMQSAKDTAATTSQLSIKVSAHASSCDCACCMLAKDGAFRGHHARSPVCAT